MNAINNLGVVVGRDELRNAFAWQSGGGQRKLPLLDDPGDRHDCATNDVNDAGWIVGRCGHYATLWLPDGQGGYAVAKLNDLVEQDGVPVDRFRWSEAIRIGEDGRILLWTHEDERSRVWDLEGPPYSSVLLTPVVKR